MANGKGGPTVTWANIIIATVAVVGLVFTSAAAGWGIFQTQLASIERQMATSDIALVADFKELRAGVEKLRSEQISRNEHTEFDKRINDQLTILRERLNVLETTRPTTGELQGAASGLKDQINEVKERMRFLEQAPRPEKVQQAPLR